MMDGVTIQAIFSNATAAVAVILLFGVSVFVHEFGHFLAARLCGLVVDVFSIGFGPALWKKRLGTLTLKIGCIPFGGYVALPQLDPAGMEAVQGAAEGGPSHPLPRIDPWKKMVVSLAGAVGNLLFALVLAWIVYSLDKPVGPAWKGAMVGEVRAGTPAAAAGLRAGDAILEANGQTVESWPDLIQIGALSETVLLRVRRPDGTDAAMTLATGTNDNVFAIRTLEGVEPGAICRVGLVAPGSMAERAGIRPGDVIRTFYGVAVAGRSHLVALVQERDGQSTPLTVERDGETVALEVTPVQDPEHGMVRMGIVFDATTLPPLQQIRQDASGIFRFLKALITPAQAEHAAKSVGGPVSIFVAFWLYAKAGLILVLGFARFLNVNLAILNLLPIPVLDGGHVLFSLYEAIVRRPPHPRVVGGLVNGFAAILIALMLFLSFRDVKLWSRVTGRMRAPAAEAGGRP